MSAMTMPSQRQLLAARQTKNRFAWLSRLLKTQRQTKISIVCESGVVWVTIENDARDYFVRASETRCFSSTGRIVAQGLGDAVFYMEKCQNPNIEYSK